ncbi:MAG: acyl-CoA thioesterase [Alphaproteobacteria bacterium]|nr:acyl-CoA thioesterase [Alphaproteobacteria bacterium]
MLHLYPVTIRETHIDSLGHVNNAVYLTLFEEARWEWITAGGYGLAEIKQYRQSPVILDVTAKFLREVHLREAVEIESRLLSYEGKIAKLQQDLVRTAADGSKTVCCAAVFTMGFFDLESRKLIAPTPLWKKALGLESE